MRGSVTRLAILAAVAAVSCSSPAGTIPVTNGESAALLHLRSLSWKGDATSVGKAVTVAELDSQTAVFSDTGVSLVAGGVVAASDGSIKTWALRRDSVGRWTRCVDRRRRYGR